MKQLKARSDTTIKTRNTLKRGQSDKAYKGKTVNEILSNLKCRIVGLYETFINDEIDSFNIGQIRLTIYRLRPISEAGRLQLEVLIKFFNEDVLSRFQQKWDKEKLIWRKANMESVFDIITQMGYVAA